MHGEDGSLFGFRKVILGQIAHNGCRNVEVGYWSPLLTWRSLMPEVFSSAERGSSRLGVGSLFVRSLSFLLLYPNHTLSLRNFCIGRHRSTHRKTFYYGLFESRFAGRIMASKSAHNGF